MVNAPHIRQEGLRRFACVCGGRFDAPIQAEAKAVATAANAWAALHDACAPYVARASRHAAGPGPAKERT